MANLPALRSRLAAATSQLRLEEKRARLSELRVLAEAEDFWADAQRAGEISREIGALEVLVKKWDGLRAELETLEEFSAAGDPALAEEVEAGATRLGSELDAAEEDLFFTGSFDEGDAILEIQAGTGGTDAADFAEMLERMYLRGLPALGLTPTVTDRSPGEEAGIRSVQIEVRGPRAYGLLRRERGVHRLIRLSPFNAKSLRQTSFAEVAVTPIVPETAYELDERELRIDVFRASGKGGQGVNTTDSAVRVTHLPTGVQVSCQNERSQMQNKAICLAVLRGRLAARAEDDREAELRRERGERADVGFGSQIRTVTLQPYQLVKDHRTDWETSQTVKYLDGELIGDAITAACRAGA